MSEEQRQFPRMRSLLGARARYDQRRTTVDCVIRNISEHGALLVVSDAVLLPNTFELEVTQRQRSYNARVCWRSGTRIGVSFEPDGPRPAAPSGLDIATRLKLAEQDNERLKHRIHQLTEAG